jgi:hypothetical protein
MTKRDRNKLIADMYPQALRDIEYGGYEAGEESSLNELAMEVCDGLSVEMEEFAATVVITALQLEIKLARDMILKLKSDVAYAEEVFADTCDCANDPDRDGYLCVPCKKLNLFRQHINSAKKQISRCNLIIP